MSDMWERQAIPGPQIQKPNNDLARVMVRTDTVIDPKPAVKPRLTVVETVYYSPPDADPTCTETRFSRQLTTDEQPYIRRLKVGEEWQKLDLGWLKEVSTVVLSNMEGMFLNVIPTEQERAETAKKVLEIAFHPSEEGDVWVAPGEGLRINPVRLDCRIRCRHGEAKVTVSAYPR